MNLAHSVNWAELGLSGVGLILGLMLGRTRVAWSLVYWSPATEVRAQPTRAIVAFTAVMALFATVIIGGTAGAIPAAGEHLEAACAQREPSERPDFVPTAVVRELQSNFDKYAEFTVQELISAPCPKDSNSEN
jgi:hypothetical protein